MTVTSMTTWKTNGVLLRNRKIHDIVGHTSASYICGHHGLWPSWSLFVAVIVEPQIYKYKVYKKYKLYRQKN